MYVNQLHHSGIRAILDYDNTIFDTMVVPSTLTLADVVDRILFKYGDTPLFCPEPDVIKFYIGKWSTRRLPLWNRYNAAITAQYNPLENYDRNEESKTHLTHGHVITTDDDLTHGETITTDDDLTHGETITTDDDLTNGLVTENKVSADNAATYQPNTKSENSGTDARDITEEHTGTDERDKTEEHTGTDERDVTETHSGTDYTHFENRIHGNIGVTTSQQMLESELDLIPRLDLIDYIADDFKSEFCLYIYY